MAQGGVNGREAGLCGEWTLETHLFRIIKHFSANQGCDFNAWVQQGDICINLGEMSVTMPVVKYCSTNDTRTASKNL